ncbi:threonine ammonia-lyase IlvA [Terrilactibacillus laevilacticus]|uniref:L-threonine dehydratase n=1 Tax=Terrilactibacillus laevilacticus TaxID=1380157 RepID=A0ABW5PP89_9BACI|nr:threonine ammonia-lyase IlvA [Terrilactibacillus laevilacticus]
MKSVKELIRIEDILVAHNTLKDVVIKTPLQREPILSDKYECDVYLKREDLQVVRSFKIRGAYNCIQSLSEEDYKNGVVCASAGNHAQGVAYTCNKLGIKAAIFMPSTTPKQKVNQVRFFGGSAVEVILVGDTFDSSYHEAVYYCQQHQMTFIHPFDNPGVIAGQGTIGVEVLNDIDQPIDYAFMSIGGGGLISGTGTYMKGISPTTQIIGVEPEGAACMHESMKQGKVITLPKIDKFVDGAAVKQPGQLTYEICQDILDDIVVVPEGKVCSAILDLYSKNAIVAEPAGALPIAALDSYKEEIKGKTVVCVISGGNNDIDRMQEIKELSLVYEGLKHYFIVNFPQRPRALKEFLDNVLGPNDDIARFEYIKKTNKQTGPALVGLELANKEDYTDLIQRMNEHGIKYQEITNDPTLFNLLV